MNSTSFLTARLIFPSNRYIEGKGREGKGREWKRREGKGREGKGGGNPSNLPPRAGPGLRIGKCYPLAVEVVSYKYITT